MTKGIDVSKHNGDIDWENVKKSGDVDFAILRAGYGKLASQRDAQFERNYAGCKENGIPVGAYWYSYATSRAEAIQEANVFLQVVKGKSFEYPLYFDIEEKKQFALGRDTCSAMARAFCETLENAGYYAGIYSSKSHLESYLTAEVRERFTVWVAHYGVGQTSYSGKFGMWQKSETGRIDGISGNVDLDECYVDYPEIIQGLGLNGFQKQEKTVETVENPVETPELKGIDIQVIIDGKQYLGTVYED